MASAQVLSALIKPPTFKGEKEKFVPWKMKFITFLGTIGCAVALKETYDKSLPSKEDVSALDETDPGEKLLILAAKNNAMAMQAIIMALEKEDDMNHVIAVQQRDSTDWPTGKAWKVWKRIEDEYQPTDTTSKVEMTRAIKAITLEADDNPKVLLSKIARIEATYRTALTDDEQRDIVWAAGSGLSYGAIMLMTDQQCKANRSRPALAEELCEAMYLQYRMDLTVKGKASSGVGETTLAATSGSFKGTCFRCKKQGHRKSECPEKGESKASEKSTAAVGEGGGKKERYNGNCGFCDKKGHREADCWKKYPEKMPAKKKTSDVAAAVTMEELVVCSVDSLSYETDAYRCRECYNTAFDATCEEIEVTASRNTYGEDAIMKLMRDRLQAVLKDPDTVIIGVGRVGDVPCLNEDGPSTIAKTVETTSIFSRSCSRWNLGESERTVAVSDRMTAEPSTWTISGANSPSTYANQTRGDEISGLSVDTDHLPTVFEIESDDEAMETFDNAMAMELNAVTNEVARCEQSEVKLVWKYVRDKGRKIKARAGMGPPTNERILVIGSPSDDTYEIARSDDDDDDFVGTFPIDDEGVEREWWENYHCWELCLAAHYSAQLEFPSSEQMLRSRDIWIGDTGASMHVTFSQYAGRNIRATDGHTRGVSGEAMQFNGVMDLPCIKCDKHGNEEFALTLTDVNYLETSNYNLFSITKLLSKGWTMSGTATSMVLTNGARELNFDIKVQTRRGVLFCACLKRTEESDEVSGAASGGGSGRSITMSILKAHAVLGHCNEAATRRTAKHLDWTITRGSLPPCESCATGKAKQKDVPTVSEHVKADKPNGRWFRDSSTLKAPAGIACYLPVWDMVVDEYCSLKMSTFYKTKNAFIEPLCENLQKWQTRGMPVLVIRQDNAGENKALQARVQSADWKLDITFEYTAPYTPQQNSLVERAFAEIASKARAMMNAANVPLEYRWRLFPSAADTAVKLDWLQVIERNGETKTRIEFYGLPLPRFVKYLRTWGEAGTVKIPKDGKVLPRGVTCVFIGYATDHEGNCYRMWNPETGRVMLSRDVTFLQRMFFEKANTDATKHEPVVYIPTDKASAVIEPEDAEFDLIGAKVAPASREGDRIDDSAAPPMRKVSFADDVGGEEMEPADDDDDGFTPVVGMTTRSGRISKPASRLIEEMGVAASTMASVQNYYACLVEYDEDEVALTTEVANAVVECAAVGAALGGGFDDTKELRVMKYEEAINGPDGKAWQEEVDNEHARMVKNKVWKAVKKSDLPPGTIPIDSTWAMKKKSNGTLRGRLNARGFKQIEGVHYDGSSIHAPVTNSATIRIVLTMMLMALWYGILLDVKGAFLNGEFTNGERIYMKVPKGMEKHYPSDVVLLLLKCLYGLKQAAMAFWKRLLICMRSMGFERSMSDPCLYYKWTENNGLVIIVSWIDDNLIVGSKAAVLEARKDMMDRFECEDCGEIEEYVGCKIVKDGRELKFTQPVLLQSYSDEFELPNRNMTTPATPGTVLQKVEAGKELSGQMQTKYRSGVGKLMHMMQYSRPEIYNSVRDLARHMTVAGKEHFEAMLRVMKYCVDTPDRGLVLKPEGEWDGKPDSIEFVISGRSDSDYAKEASCKSVSGHRVLLNGAPVMFKSGTQRIVALSVCEAELYAGISCAQDMLYVKHVIESIGLKVKLPMRLEMDNKGAVDLANNWSIGGRTRHIGTKIEFLRMHKENGVLEVVWMPGKDNEADMFTKNLAGPLFNRFAQVFVGEDKYSSTAAPE